MSGTEKSASRTRVLLTIGMLLVVVVAPIVSVAIVLVSSSRRAEQERCASTSLKTISSAEADFRSNDRDWNHVNDFWTGDVKGLYTMTSAAVRGAVAGNPRDPSIQLIDFSVAAGDADGTFIPAGGENLPLNAFGPPAVKSGYWYAALLLDLTLSGTREATYRLDTEGTPAMGPCHNTSKFGFVAFPDSSVAGKYVFRMNENNTIFREELIGKPREGSKTPPGLDAIPKALLEWPDDGNLKRNWSEQLQ